MKKIISILVFSTVFMGVAPGLKADENSWGFVRQSAEWANNNSTIMDAIIKAVIDLAAVLGTGEHTRLNVDMGGVNMHVRIGVNQSYTGLALSAYNTTKTYTHKFELYLASDNSKALELFFNTSGSFTSAGALMKYKLFAFNPTSFSNPTTIVESFAFRRVGTGERRQVYSWSGPLTSGGTDVSANGRVVLEEMGTVLCVKSVVALTNLASQPSFSSIVNTLCGGTDSVYYKLAYGVKLAAPNESLALFGMERQTASEFTIGHKDICSFANANNFGQFGSGGFIIDGVASGSVGAEYPTPTAVTNLYAQIGTIGTQDNSDANDLSDDLRRATVAGLTGIAFVGNNTAPSTSTF